MRTTRSAAVILHLDGPEQSRAVSPSICHANERHRHHRGRRIDEPNDALSPQFQSQRRIQVTVRRGRPSPHGILDQLAAGRWCNNRRPMCARACVSSKRSSMAASPVSCGAGSPVNCGSIMRPGNGVGPPQLATARRAMRERDGAPRAGPACSSRFTLWLTWTVDKRLRLLFHQFRELAQLLERLSNRGQRSPEIVGGQRRLIRCVSGRFCGARQIGGLDRRPRLFDELFQRSASADDLFQIGRELSDLRGRQW